MDLSIRKWIFASVVVLGSANIATADSLINGGFEEPVIPDNSYRFLLETTSGLGWLTDASDNKIELWRNVHNGISAHTGMQFAEINANEVSALYQDVIGIGIGQMVDYRFAHRGRLGDDTLALIITDLGADNGFGTGGDDTQLFYSEFTAAKTDWILNTGSVTSLTLGNTIRFEWASVSSVGGPTVGNFIDSVAFGVGINNPVPEPATLLLLGAGLFGLAGVMHKRKK